MYCYNCGEEIPDDSVFCKACGVKQPDIPKKSEAVREEKEELSEVAEESCSELSEASEMTEVSDVPETEDESFAFDGADGEEEDVFEEEAEYYQVLTEESEDVRGYEGSEDDEKVNEQVSFVQKFKTNIMVIVTGLVVIACVLLTWLGGGSTIDLNKYMTLTAEGYDTFGTVKAEFDIEKFGKDYDKKISKKMGTVSDGHSASESFKDQYIGGSLSGDSGLSNGDQIVYAWECDDAAVKEMFGFKLKHENIEFTVNGLEEGEFFDPFEGVIVLLCRNESSVYPHVEGKPTDTAGSDLSFEVKFDNDGTYVEAVKYDEVTTDMNEDPVKFCMEKYGRMPSPTIKYIDVKEAGNIEEEPEASKVKAAYFDKYYINANADVYGEMSVTSKILYTIPARNMVQTVGFVDDWAVVVRDGNIVYIPAGYLVESRELITTEEENTVKAAVEQYLRSYIYDFNNGSYSGLYDIIEENSRLEGIQYDFIQNAGSSFYEELLSYTIDSCEQKDENTYHVTTSEDYLIEKPDRIPYGLVQRCTYIVKKQYDGSWKLSDYASNLGITKYDPFEE